jgi:hypothetical protein
VSLIRLFSDDDRDTLTLIPPNLLGFFKSPLLSFFMMALRDYECEGGKETGLKYSRAKIIIKIRKILTVCVYTKIM